jgi:hypothetical protein
MVEKQRNAQIEQLEKSMELCQRMYVSLHFPVMGPLSAIDSQSISRYVIAVRQQTGCCDDDLGVTAIFDNRR